MRGSIMKSLLICNRFYIKWVRMMDWLEGKIDMWMTCTWYLGGDDIGVLCEWLVNAENLLQVMYMERNMFSGVDDLYALGVRGMNNVHKPFDHLRDSCCHEHFWFLVNAITAFVFTITKFVITINNKSQAIYWFCQDLSIVWKSWRYLSTPLLVLSLVLLNWSQPKTLGQSFDTCCKNLLILSKPLWILSK